VSKLDHHTFDVQRTRHTKLFVVLRIQCCQYLCMCMCMHLYVSMCMYCACDMSSEERFRFIALCYSYRSIDLLVFNRIQEGIFPFVPATAHINHDPFLRFAQLFHMENRPHTVPYPNCSRVTDSHHCTTSSICWGEWRIRIGVGKTKSHKEEQTKRRTVQSATRNGRSCARRSSSSC
jgi:hypothetical protein